MLDKFNRNIDYLRISVTDKCNLRCIYCMPVEGIENLHYSEILSYEEIIRICRCVSNLGISKIKITGGEPLIRKDITKLIKKIKSIDGINEVTITTNGVLVYEMIDELSNAGIDAINISLDTLDKEKFFKITRRDEYEKVHLSIDKLIELGIKVKINCLVIKEYNFDEIVKIARYAKDNNIDVRFIELMPIGYGKKFTGVSNKEVLKTLEKEYGTFIKVNEKRGNGPSNYYKNKNFKGYIGFISAISNEFCQSCNRIRLTSNGFLKLCLHYNKGIDLKSLLRSNITDKELEKIIYNAIQNKPLEHRFYHEANVKNLEDKNMVEIGG